MVRGCDWRGKKGLQEKRREHLVNVVRSSQRQRCMQLPIRVEIGLEQHLIKLVENGTGTEDDAQLVITIETKQIEIAATDVAPTAIDEGRLGMDAARIQIDAHSGGQETIGRHLVGVIDRRRIGLDGEENTDIDAAPPGAGQLDDDAVVGQIRIFQVDEMAGMIDSVIKRLAQTVMRRRVLDETPGGIGNNGWDWCLAGRRLNTFWLAALLAPIILKHGLPRDDKRPLHGQRQIMAHKETRLREISPAGPGSLAVD